jgi:hypothetical protein
MRSMEQVCVIANMVDELERDRQVQGESVWRERGFWSKTRVMDMSVRLR